VPAGLSGPARLRLRYGGEGFEVEGVTMPLVIEAEPGATVTLRPHHGLEEWWCLSEHSGALPSRQVSGTASLQSSDRGVAIAHEPDRMARLIASSTCRSSARQPSITRAEPVARRGSRSRFCPLRI
jgi:hypothetical protein